MGLWYAISYCFGIIIVYPVVPIIISIVVIVGLTCLARFLQGKGDHKFRSIFLELTFFLFFGWRCLAVERSIG